MVNIAAKFCILILCSGNFIADATPRFAGKRFSVTDPKFDKEILEKIVNPHSTVRQQIDANACWDGIVEQLNEVLGTVEFPVEIAEVTSEAHPGVRVTFSNGVGWGLLPFTNGAQDAWASDDGQNTEFQGTLNAMGELIGNVHVDVESPNGTWSFDAQFNLTGLWFGFNAGYGPSGSSFVSAGFDADRIQVDLEQLQLEEEIKDLVFDALDSDVAWSAFDWFLKILDEDYIILGMLSSESYCLMPELNVMN